MKFAEKKPQYGIPYDAESKDCRIYTNTYSARGGRKLNRAGYDDNNFQRNHYFYKYANGALCWKDTYVYAIPESDETITPIRKG